MRRGLVQSKRWLVVVALSAGVAAGCAAPLAGDIPAYPTASQLEVDTQACEQAATGRAEFERRADYMACMISRGYRTYVTVATYWNLAELNVLAASKGKQAQAQQAQSQVLLDLQTCATDAGAVAGLAARAGGSGRLGQRESAPARRAHARRRPRRPRRRVPRQARLHRPHPQAPRLRLIPPPLPSGERAG
jgi:hypothetical protein